MPYSYNNTREQREEAAERDLAEKLKLEPGLEESMAAIFLLMMFRARDSFVNNQDMNIFDSFRADVEQILRNHYIVVEDTFKTQIRQSIANYIGYPIAFDKATREVDQELKRFRDEQSSISSRQIIDTVNKDYSKYLLAAVLFYAKNNIDPTNEQIIDKANELFQRTIDYRSQRVAVTETQTAAENTKFTEIVILGSILATINALSIRENLTQEQIARILSTGKGPEIQEYLLEDQGNIQYLITKDWAGILDDLIRDWHLEADGQRRNSDEYFIVMGEQLMYPGDRSRGASPENVCNCRCSAIYRIGNVYLFTITANSFNQ